MEVTRKEGGEENEGRAPVTKERDEQNMLSQQALQNENFQSQSDLRDNPLGHATNNQTTEETSTGMGTQPPQGNFPQRPRPTPQRETGVRETVVEIPPQAPQMENDVRVPWMERQLLISSLVITFSATMLVPYHSVDRNKLSSVQMRLYEASIWLLYLTFVFGGIMLAIALTPPLTPNLRTFYNCLLCLAAEAGITALGFEAYLLLPESRIRLAIICAIQIAALLVVANRFKEKFVRLGSLLLDGW